MCICSTTRSLSNRAMPCAVRMGFRLHYILRGPIFLCMHACVTTVWAHRHHSIRFDCWCVHISSLRRTVGTVICELVNHLFEHHAIASIYLSIYLCDLCTAKKLIVICPARSSRRKIILYGIAYIYLPYSSRQRPHKACLLEHALMME